MEFVDDAKSLWKKWSIQVAAVWAFIVGTLAYNPTILSAWFASLPDAVQALFPGWVRFALMFSSLLGSIYVARAAKQKP